MRTMAGSASLGGSTLAAWHPPRRRGTALPAPASPVRDHPLPAFGRIRTRVRTSVLYRAGQGAGPGVRTGGLHACFEPVLVPQRFLQGPFDVFNEPYPDGAG